MSTYTFTASHTFDLATHKILFDATKITVKLSSTGQTVHTSNYGRGVAIMCTLNDFKIGSLTDNGVFTKEVNLALTDAKIWLKEQNNNNLFIGSNDETDNNIWHKYDLNRCPVRVINGPLQTVKFECPCDSASGPCENVCYTYG